MRYPPGVVDSLSWLHPGCFRATADGNPVPAYNPGMSKPFATTLGVLAGGRATRLGGLDKAWLQRDGQPQVLRLVRRLRDDVAAVMVSANHDVARYAAHGLVVVADRVCDIGPIAALDALARACTTPWLLSVPVDAICVNDGLLRSLQAAGANGAYAQDDDGSQPLLALWKVEALRAAVATAITDGNYAIHALQSRMGMGGVRFDGVRFGNLNTPDDLIAAGVEHWQYDTNK